MKWIMSHIIELIWFIYIIIIIPIYIVRSACTNNPHNRNKNKNITYIAKYILTRSVLSYGTTTVMTGITITITKLLP